MALLSVLFLKTIDRFFHIGQTMKGISKREGVQRGKKTQPASIIKLEIKGEENMKDGLISRRELLKFLGTGAGAAVLVSCAPQATAQPTSAPAATQVPPTSAPKKVTLRYQNHWTKETDAHYKGMQWLYAEFQKKYPEITIQNILNPDRNPTRRSFLTALRETARILSMDRVPKCGNRDTCLI